MENSKIISRLELIEASASVLLQEAAKLKKELQPVSQPKKSVLSDEKKAKILRRMHKNMQPKTA